MPIRKTPLFNGEYYHVFNRSIDNKPIFTSRKECKRALIAVQYYQFSLLPLKLSLFLRLSVDHRSELLMQLSSENKRLINLLCYCLMPNHFHFLLKQTEDKGISRFVRNFENSYTKYFNKKEERDGPIFKGQFKAVRIERDEQLLHVSRYIHLNPYSSFLVKDYKSIMEYEWSSIGEYLGNRKGFCYSGLILSFYNSSEGYKKFILNHADYQRRLEGIKHLTFE